jgi:histidinol-phosphate aminotransferase
MSNDVKIDFRALANSAVRNLMPYQPGKPIEEVERELSIKSALKLASNENPLGPSPLAIHALHDTLQNAHLYPDAGCYQVKKALAQHHGVQMDQITVGNGSENILELIVKTYLHKDDTAVISQYAFIMIPLLIQSYAAQVKVVPAKNWRHDVAAMVAAIDAKTRVLFLVNPNNPTGTYISKEEFKYLLNMIPPRIVVVVDEAYAEYISQEDYPQTLNFLKDYPNLVITRTFSKIYGLAALRVGYAISSLDIADMLNRARLPFNVNSIAAKAAVAALNDQQHVEKSKQINQQGMQHLQIELAKLQLASIPSLGNFLSVEVGDAAKIYQQLLLRGVIVRPLKAYHMPQHIRITIGLPEQNERLIAALHHCLQEG